MISSDTAWPAPNHQQSGEGRQSHKFSIRQERSVQRQGYRQIRVKSRNRFRPMLTLLTKEGYERVAVEPQADAADTRIHFLKTL